MIVSGHVEWLRQLLEIMSSEMISAAYDIVYSFMSWLLIEMIQKTSAVLKEFFGIFWVLSIIFFN